ncbi:helix-turn-helix domain-containing protein [Pedococcus sp. 5OH_020]|uniref:helix-turn-helix domain-containing protein n=1 Tax=Pedococcus sp. 5OH_020 TaxID=2989814 RepID=UPI0022E9BBBA|nr:helix-turn-helix domain-containing protein [Pedococcus sp. 5OH_020]
MLRARAAHGIRDHEPIFCDALGGHRDPSNVRRELREARFARRQQARRDLGIELAKARRAVRLTQRDAASQLGWPRTRIGLVETGRVRVDRTDVATLLDHYAVPAVRRQAIVDLAEVAAAPVDADALSWITSHNFRKTTATILDEAGQSARAIAHQLGHARPSMTQDVYMGRGPTNPGAAEAIQRAMGAGRRPKTGP